MIVRFALTVAFCLLLCVPVARCLAQEPTPAFEPVKTEVMRGGDKAQAISVELNGATDLFLVVTYGPDNYSSDLAIWAEPRLVDAAGDALALTTVNLRKFSA
jgi:hypothetical protein